MVKMSPITVKFEFSEDAKAYILADDGSIFVQFEPIVVGCGGYLNAPTVHTGKPLVPEDFNEFQSDGIIVYTPKGYFSSARKIKIYLLDEEGFPTLKVHSVC
jgi:hypothetical protein